MATNLTTVPKETRLATPAPEFSNEQIRLLGETVAKGCDQNELAFFLHVAKLKRLDPFTGQIHVVKRWDSSLGKEKMTVQVGIDGFRVIASRTDDLAGIDDPEYDTETDEHPNVAKVTVYRYGRDNERIPYKATARWTEYAQTKKDGNLGPMWKKLPYLMLGKCAEALALRKAFPDELSGMYTNEEMDQAENETPAQQGKKPVTQPSRASDKKQTQPATQAQGQKPATQSGVTEISGVIEQAKSNAAGDLWLSLPSGLVKVVPDKIDSDMKQGYFIKLKGEKKTAQGVGDFWLLAGLIELSPIQDGTPETKAEPVAEGQMATDASVVAAELFPDTKGNATVDAMVGDGTLKKASDLPETAAKKPGTIGVRRGQRLWTLMNQNKKSNHDLTEEEVYKMLSALPIPITHIRDLEVGMNDQFEKWMTGEEDWHEFWEK
jgi:phage recombination protein Bet